MRKSLAVGCNQRAARYFPDLWLPASPRSWRRAGCRLWLYRFSWH